jgi:hypothetical protein
LEIATDAEASLVFLDGAVWRAFTTKDEGARNYFALCAFDWNFVPTFHGFQSSDFDLGGLDPLGTIHIGHRFFVG